MAHVFNPSLLHRLDDPKRQEYQNPQSLIEKMHPVANTSLLDFGAGAGYFTFPIAKAFPENNPVHVVDIQKEMLDHLIKRAKEQELSARMEPHLLEAFPLSISDGSVGLAWMVNVFHEIDDRKTSLSEIFRVLAPGGSLFIADWKPEETPMGPPPVGAGSRGGNHHLPSGGRIFPDPFLGNLFDASGDRSAKESGLRTLPRNGRELVGGLPWLGRMIDKARMINAGSIGDYEFPCGMDMELLNHLKISPEEFIDLVKNGDKGEMASREEFDDAILERLSLRTSSHDESAGVREWVLNHGKRAFSPNIPQLARSKPYIGFSRQIRRVVFSFQIQH